MRLMMRRVVWLVRTGHSCWPCSVVRKLETHEYQGGCDLKRKG